MLSGYSSWNMLNLVCIKGDNRCLMEAFVNLYSNYFFNTTVFECTSQYEYQLYLQKIGEVFYFSILFQHIGSKTPAFKQ